MLLVTLALSQTLAQHGNATRRWHGPHRRGLHGKPYPTRAERERERKRRLNTGLDADECLALDLSGLSCASAGACTVQELLAEGGTGLPCEPFKVDQIAIDFAYATVAHSNLGGTGCGFGREESRCERVESMVCPPDGSGIPPIGPTHVYHRNLYQYVPGFDAWVDDPDPAITEDRSIYRCEVNAGEADDAAGCGGGGNSGGWNGWRSASNGKPSPDTKWYDVEAAAGRSTAEFGGEFELFYYGKKSNIRGMRSFDQGDYDPAAEGWVNGDMAGDHGPGTGSLPDRCFEGIAYANIAANALDANGVRADEGGKTHVDLLMENWYGEPCSIFDQMRDQTGANYVRIPLTNADTGVGGGHWTFYNNNPSVSSTDRKTGQCWKGGTLPTSPRGWWKVGKAPTNNDGTANPNKEEAPARKWSRCESKAK